MKPLRLRSDPIIGLLILLVLGVSYWHYQNDEPLQEMSVPPIQNTAAPGELTFDEKFFDFGVLIEGEVVKHTFTFKNTGASAVTLSKIETSCGCTTTNDGVLKSYAPGESAELEVVVDTKDKKGIVVKTVTLTLENAATPTLELSLAMQLRPPPHPVIGEPRNINQEEACKSCHLISGEGQSGVFLYHRVCAQCHGKKGVGGFGPALNDGSRQHWSDEQFKQIIHQGLPEKNMPSFVDAVSPPLSGEQVDSLIGYIRSLKKE